MEITLIIMAAGIGSRYKGGIKQLEAMDDQGRIIIDYSVYDAVEAGFNHIIFVIRREIEDDFRCIIGNRIERLYCERGVRFEYAFQALEDIPQGHSVPAGRVRPWGTGQAVLSCRELASGPFAVINADDYYGRDAFQLLAHYLAEDPKEAEACLIGFVLKNTLSENGGVTRGICDADGQGMLRSIRETYNIRRTGGMIVSDSGVLDPDAVVSMNMWGFGADFMRVLGREFTSFLDSGEDLAEQEFLIPKIVGRLLEQKKIRVHVRRTRDRWFGITYKEDLEPVRDEFTRLLARGEYRPR
ncbi:hypothetical protein BHK98_01015 [Hornefia porci]|uniref:Nucleotidyltransferase n=1 Tax=Hornefia porci TaxID=2652292 RepID=A0A1Q9JF09_9FIRM|nr:hypothetical protein [Hornefia porci]OLR54785.1 hypothetical protein BHK98_01015 [Hornefia porci]